MSLSNLPFVAESMSGHVTSLLPLRRPWWAAVMVVMLVFGFYQELAKIQLNDYLTTLTDHPSLDAASPEDRALFWSSSVPPRIVNYYEIHVPWPVFHHLSRRQLMVLKWGLAVLIVAVFFSLDALFLHVAGAWSLRGALVGIYGFVGVVMALFGALAPGEGGYAVARELLGFLQSPLPSLMLVFVQWLQQRTRAQTR